MWVPTFRGWEGPGTCFLPSQQVIFCKVFVQIVVLSLFCQSLAFGGRRGKFHHENVLLPVPSSALLLAEQGSEKYSLLLSRG